MTIFKPRLTAPSSTDKHWLRKAKGGVNPCIEIKNGSCLPNCVGYAWGRVYELLGKKHSLSTGNAENWYNKKDGYSRGQEPKLGAVICWRKGKAGVASDGAGHVAVVEQIKSDGTIVCSESSYGGSRFNVRTLKKPYKLGTSYTFQGFIYPPYEFEEEVKEEPKVQEHEQNVQEVKPKEEPKPEPKPVYNLKVGDRVKIKKAGRSTKNGGNFAYGIGWTRYVTAIHKGAAYPYQVGNSGRTASAHTTGFYKEEALTKI